MKFGKSLSNQIEEALPEWRDKFLSYKELKKCLKYIPPHPSPPPPPPAVGSSDDAVPEAGRPWKRQRAVGDDAVGPTASPSSCSSSSSPPAGVMVEEEAEFTRLLEAELDKFNTFFVEKEEDYVIRLKDLQDRMVAANDAKDEMMRIRKEIVDFHGEMVLLENYSALNYTGLVKILKKYDKRTGTLLRLPFIQKVLQEPFFTTDLLYKLVKECETMLDCLFPAKELPSTEVNGVAKISGEKQHVDQEAEPSSLAKSGIPDLETIKYMESLYMKSTVVALRVLKEIRKGSSTVSVFSLPPLHSTDGVEERWGKVPIVEQEAK